MADNRVLSFLSSPGRAFDLVAGVRAWQSVGGRISLPGVYTLAPFNPEMYLEPDKREYYSVDASNLDALQPIADKYDLKLSFDAPWYGPGIDVNSYHRASPPIIFWSFEPAMWGQGDGGEDQADFGLLAFARASGAAYVLARTGVGYEVARHRFVPDKAGYRFVLPPHDPKRGHGLLWVDVCRDLGGVDPTGHIESGRISRPFGYTRHLLAGANPAIFEYE